MADVNRDTTDSAHKPVQHWFAIKFLIDDVTNGAGACELEDEGIDPGDVIGQKEEAALGQMFETEGADTIENFDERPAKKMERALTGGHNKDRFFSFLFFISPR